MATRKASTGQALDASVSTDARMRSRTAARITKTLLMILILDVICTLPYVIQGVGLLVAKGKGIFDEHSNAGIVYDAIVEIFLNLRPSYNFWLYVFQHPEFRIRVKSIIRRMLLPFYRSKCCTKCKLEEPQSPLNSGEAWSMNTPGVKSQGPWFKSYSPNVIHSPNIQNGKDYLSLPVKHGDHQQDPKLPKGAKRPTSHSMDSEPDWAAVSRKVKT